MKKRGQIQSENIILLGLVITASLFLFYYAINQVSESHKIAKTEDTLNSLVEKVNSIIVLGKGSKDMVVVDIPKTIESITFEEKKIVLTMRRKGEIFKISKKTIPYVVGNLPRLIEIHKIPVQKINATLVLVGKTPVLFGIDPNCITIEDLMTGEVELKVSGAGFKENSEIFLDSMKYNQEKVTFIDGERMTFLADQSIMQGPGTFMIQVNNPVSMISNEVYLEVVPLLMFCSEIGEVDVGDVGEVV